MHSHHSHSGDYISHAHDPLEHMVQSYIDRGFEVLCLTEHMPRLDQAYLYPEEKEKGYGIKELVDDFSKYLVHAKKVQSKYQDKIKIIIGFEVEGIDEAHVGYSADILQNPLIQMSVGSVHYVHGIPIDFSKELWVKAKAASKGGLTRSLYKDYFELVSKVIDLKPQVIGHFDLIRLCQPEDDFDESTNKLTKDIRIQTDWPEVWEVIISTIENAGSYGAMFELNSAAIRKGWDCPYPKSDLVQAVIEYGGGRFCLSDDAHSINQIGLNYKKTLQYLKDHDVSKLYHLDVKDGEVVTVADDIEDIETSKFWSV